MSQSQNLSKTISFNTMGVSRKSKVVTILFVYLSANLKMATLPKTGHAVFNVSLSANLKMSTLPKTGDAVITYLFQPT